MMLISKRPYLKHNGGHYFLNLRGTMLYEVIAIACFKVVSSFAAIEVAAQKGSDPILPIAFHHQMRRHGSVVGVNIKLVPAKNAAKHGSIRQGHCMDAVSDSGFKITSIGAGKQCFDRSHITPPIGAIQLCNG